MKILVIDDKANDESHPRMGLLEVFKQQTGVTYELIEPEQEALKIEMAKVEAGEYDLIIVDYQFDKTITIFRTGASLYSLIRSYTKTTPIYLISVKTAPTNQIGDFELFIKDELIDNYSALKADIESHSRLNTCTTLESFLELIICPEEAAEDIEAIVSSKVLIQESDSAESDNQIPEEEIIESLNLRLFKWLAHSLLRKEGPLVSNVGAAALLGVSTEYFDSISEQFNSSLYKGVFHQSFETRWWGCLLEENIYERSDPENLLDNLPFKEAASLILGATKDDDFSTCAKCGQRYPDGLGIVKDQENELLPVQIACSGFNEVLLQEPFFRNPRIIEVE